MAYAGEGPYRSPLSASGGRGTGRELVPLAADALARGLAPKGPYTLVDAPNSPVPLKLTWARDAVYPAAICLRKEIEVLDLLKFKAKADLTLLDRRLIFGFSCKDKVFRGSFSVNVPARMAEYRKKFELPNGTGLAVSAGLQYVGEGYTRPLGDQFRPTLSAQLQFGGFGGGGSNMVYSGDGVSIKNTLPVPLSWTGLEYPRFQLENYSMLKIPQLTTRYSVQRDGLRRGVPSSLGEEGGGDALHLHVSAANLVIRL